MSESQQSSGTKLNPIERALIWLAGADPELLSECPRWERVKYGAFGASVLVPVFFGMIASSYAVWTLSHNPIIVTGFVLVWGYIILTIDRVMLSTYRAFTSVKKKIVQFVMRITVALLMGLTVSHPLTLLIFKDAISTEIERQRDEEMMARRAAADGERSELEQRIEKAAATLAGHQQKYQETLGGKFLESEPEEQAPAPQAPVANPEFADIDAQINSYRAERENVRADLERWQATWDEEVRGVRSGKAGVGPNARAIERDHLSWRQDEIKRLNGVIAELTARRTKLSSEMLERSAAANAARQSQWQDLEKQKLKMFASQQGQLLDVIKAQIDSSSAELARLNEEWGKLSQDSSDRIDSLKLEKREDLMTQTITLHHMFKNRSEGGLFALTVYAILVGLFTLIDTIPLVVKFVSVPGPYDVLQCEKEKLKEEMREFDQRVEWIHDFESRVGDQQVEELESTVRNLSKVGALIGTLSSSSRFLGDPDEEADRRKRNSELLEELSRSHGNGDGSSNGNGSKNGDHGEFSKTAGDGTGNNGDSNILEEAQSELEREVDQTVSALQERRQQLRGEKEDKQTKAQAADGEPPPNGKKNEFAEKKEFTSLTQRQQTPEPEPANDTPSDLKGTPPRPSIKRGNVLSASLARELAPPSVNDKPTEEPGSALPPKVNDVKTNFDLKSFRDKKSAGPVIAESTTPPLSNVEAQPATKASAVPKPKISLEPKPGTEQLADENAQQAPPSLGEESLTPEASEDIRKQPNFGAFVKNKMEPSFGVEPEAEPLPEGAPNNVSVKTGASVKGTLGKPAKQGVGPGDISLTPLGGEKRRQG